jgi:hypothetical protein
MRAKAELLLCDLSVDKIEQIRRIIGYDKPIRGWVVDGWESHFRRHIESDIGLIPIKGEYSVNITLYKLE